MAAHREGCSRADAENGLSELFAAEPILDEALRLGLVQERSGVLHAPAKPANWADSRREFAFRALGFPASGNTHRDLAGAALRLIYGLDNLPPSLSRAQARCELLRRIVASLGESLVAGVGQPGKAFSFDPMSRSIYLAFAGLKCGTVLQADAALLSSALGGPASTIAELSTTVLRAALHANVTGQSKREEVFDLDGFAESVRKLAGKLETKPYAGRVAIAQVYDAGLASGLGTRHAR